MSHHALNHGVDRGKRAPVVGAPRCARRSWFGETWLFFCCSQAALGPIFGAWARLGLGPRPKICRLSCYRCCETFLRAL